MSADDTLKTGANYAFDGLTVKQRAFAENYVILLNGTQAAIKAGYAVSGAHVESARLLRTAKVRAYIDSLFDAGNMSAKEVIGQLSAISRANIGDYLQLIEVTRNGEIKEEWRFDLVKAIKDGNTSLIKSIKRDKFGVVVEMYDKVRTLELIGKHRRLFADVLINSPKADATANDLSDVQLAEIAAMTQAVNDAVDQLEALDAEQSASNDNE